MTVNGNIYLPGSPVAPAFLVISAITRANQMVVTVTTANSYIVGQNVYFSIPFPYGMFQLNGLTGNILAVDATNLILTISINSLLFDAFVTPSGVRVQQPATVSPQGSKNIQNYTTVPFHAVNGSTGN